MISDKIGYYVYLSICTLALLGVTILVFVGDWGYGSVAIPIIFALLLYNLAQLLMLFPVYYFSEFEYIPAENPNPEPEGEFRLFRDNLG